MPYCILARTVLRRSIIPLSAGCMMRVLAEAMSRVTLRMISSISSRSSSVKLARSRFIKTSTGEYVATVVEPEAPPRSSVPSDTTPVAFGSVPTPAPTTLSRGSPLFERRMAILSSSGELPECQNVWKSLSKRIWSSLRFTKVASRVLWNSSRLKMSTKTIAL